MQSGHFVLLIYWQETSKNNIIIINHLTVLTTHSFHFWFIVYIYQITSFPEDKLFTYFFEKISFEHCDFLNSLIVLTLKVFRFCNLKIPFPFLSSTFVWCSSPKNEMSLSCKSHFCWGYYLIFSKEFSNHLIRYLLQYERLEKLELSFLFCFVENILRCSPLIKWLS